MAISELYTPPLTNIIKERLVQKCLPQTFSGGMMVYGGVKNTQNIIEGGMPIRLEEAELLIPHHFPSPRTRPFCHRFSWMGHYAIRLSQAERLWRGLSGIWKLICCLI